MKKYKDIKLTELKEPTRTRRGKEVTCMDCNKTRVVRVTSTAKRCLTCWRLRNKTLMQTYIGKPNRGNDGKFTSSK